MGKPRRLQILGEMNTRGHYFHVISRVVDKRFAFQEPEKEAFQTLLRKVEAFSGVEVITWTILSNHFHIVLHIPEKEPDGVSDKVFWERLGALYASEALAEIRLTMEQIPLHTPGLAGAILLEAYRKRFTDRMRDLSAFMQTLKQRFTTWFNKRHQREGTLWEAPFKSLLIEGTWSSVMTVAAYVDLNAVRAGLTKDPKDYRWCGYAEAIAGYPKARKGLSLLYHPVASDHQYDLSTQQPDWRTIAALYRTLLFGEGSKRHLTKGGATLPNTEGSERLSLPAALRCRVRYFTDGLVLGETEFIEAFFTEKRDYLGPNRTSGARKMKGAEFGDLRCLRDLSKPIERRRTV